jgi:single-stranded DNA-binding protein
MDTNNKQNNRVDGLVISVTKASEEGCKTSASGKIYLKVGALNEGDDGSKNWVNLMAFGLLARNLEKRLNKKGTRAKIYGNLKQTEYPKKDGSGVGVDSTIFVSRAQIVDGDKLVTIDEFNDGSAPF